MRASELLEDEYEGPSRLVQVLRTVIGTADAKGQTVFLHFAEPSDEDVQDGAINLNLNHLMQNVGGEQFDYGTFKAAYDTDPRVKTMVADFNEKGVTPKTAKDADTTSQADSPEGPDKVSQMAKRATDVGDKL